MSLIVMPSPRPNYAGRILSLNPDKGTFFQTGGFRLTPSRPSSVVPPDAFMDSIHFAVLNGSLIDVTDNPGSIRTQNVEMEKNEESDTGMRAFVVARTENGKKVTCVVVPKDEEELNRFEKEIRETGTLDLSQIPEVENRPILGVSGIVVEEWDSKEREVNDNDPGN